MASKIIPEGKEGTIEIKKKGCKRSSSRGRESPLIRRSPVPSPLRLRPSRSSRRKECENMVYKATSIANVRVTVLQLTGLTCEDGNYVRKTSKASNKSSARVLFEEDTIVSAVASFARNAFSNETNILTHVPSLPIMGLSNPNKFKATKTSNRFKASWPAHAPLRDEDDIHHSSFAFSRVLKSECKELDEDKQELTEMSFESELVDISIGLVKGTEMIELGSTTLVVNGQSRETNTHADLIVRNEKYSKYSAGSRRSKSSNFSKKFATFSSDPAKRFSMADNATLSVQISVTLSDHAQNPYIRQEGLKNRKGQIRENTAPPPMQYICPELEHKNKNNAFETFGDTSTLSESTKSGYLIKTNGANELNGPFNRNISKNIAHYLGITDETNQSSQESPTGVNDLHKFQINSNRNQTKQDTVHDPIARTKSAFFELFCCLPNALDQDDEEIQKKSFQPNMQAVPLRHETKQNLSTNDKLINTSSKTNNDLQYPIHNPIQTSSKMLDSDDVVHHNNVNVLFYPPPQSPKETQNQEEAAKKDAITVTTDTVKSIERATMTLHHYARRFGVKAEELL